MPAPDRATPPVDYQQTAPDSRTSLGIGGFAIGGGLVLWGLDKAMMVGMRPDPNAPSWIHGPMSVLAYLLFVFGALFILPALAPWVRLLMGRGTWKATGGVPVGGLASVAIGAILGALIAPSQIAHRTRDDVAGLMVPITVAVLNQSLAQAQASLASPANAEALRHLQGYSVEAGERGNRVSLSLDSDACRQVQRWAVTYPDLAHRLRITVNQITLDPAHVDRVQCRIPRYRGELPATVVFEAAPTKAG